MILERRKNKEPLIHQRGVMNQTQVRSAGFRTVNLW